MDEHLNMSAPEDNDHHHSTVDDEAYEPTYTEAFPPLPSAASAESDHQLESSRPPKNNNCWSSGGGTVAMVIHPSVVTQVFSVPVEERQKFYSESQFGEKGKVQTKICSDIMSRTGVAIEISSAKDQSLTVVITGKSDAVMKARKLIVQQLQTQTKSTIMIPKDHHRFLLGPQGKILSKLELQTSTRISVPKQDDMSEEIVISGTREGIEKARHEIQLISDEQAKLALVRIPIPKVFHPFILGPNGQTVKELAERTGARINIPPMSVVKDEIVVAGEKEGVFAAEAKIREIYEEKKRTSNCVSMEVRKSQHKYVIGQRGSNISEILAETGVSVEVPPLDSPSETITLRGDSDSLGLALTAVYLKANSVTMQELEVPGWLHRFIIGPKGSTIRDMNQEFPKVHIEFRENKVVLEGPPEEVEKAQQAIQSKADDLVSRMAFVELKVDAKHHKNLRRSPGLGRVKKETGVSIRIPPDDSNSNIVRIEGSPEGVAKAKMELIEMVDRMENEKIRDIVIDQRFHKALIGAQGNTIREISTRFNQVSIAFPEVSKQSDIVVLKGPKNEVDQCYKYLEMRTTELNINSFKSDVPVGADIQKYLAGKGGAKLKKVTDETETKIEFPRGNAEIITVTGKKENVMKAKKFVEAIVKELGSIIDVTLEIPQKLHTFLIGAKGRLIRSITEECGGVEIQFPPGNKPSDVITIRGPKTDVEKAKQQLLELANEKIESSYSVEVRAKPEFHGYLIGKGGSTISKVRESGVRVVFPAPNDPDPEVITIIGKKEAVEKAKQELEKQILDLTNVTEVEFHIDPKHHRYFISRKGELLNRITEECGGVEVIFPRLSSKSSLVVLKGSKEFIDDARLRLEAIVADLESHVTIDCLIPQKYHGLILGTKGQNIREITNNHDVTIKFPERSVEDVSGSSQKTNAEDTVDVMNGDGSPVHEKATNERDVIRITGRTENCEAAKDAMMSLVPTTVEMLVPLDFHRQIIGAKGSLIKQLMDAHDVNISIPPPSEKSDRIKIIGIPGKIEGAQKALEEKVKQLEDERQQKELKNFKLELEVDAKHHFSLIGRRGANIGKIQQKFDVKVQFPERESAQPNTIIITGLEENTVNAKNDILKQVQELEEQVSVEVRIDHRIHPRIIGAKGRAVSRLMEEYHVEIKFPGRDADDKDLVIISGREEDVEECKEQLLTLEDEYLQDVIDREIHNQRQTSASQTFLDNKSKDNGGHSSSSAKGFVVRGAPWSQPPQEYSNDMNDFPSLPGDLAKPTQTPTPWGKRSGH